MSLKISLAQISEYLNECIDMRKDIPEEVLSEFVFQIADKAAAHSVTVSSAYFDLKESCQKYKEFHTDDPGNPFCLHDGYASGHDGSVFRYTKERTGSDDAQMGCGSGFQAV